MPKRFTSTPTEYVTIDNQNIPLSYLPTDIIGEFGMLDKMNRELVDAAYKVELLALATTAKRASLIEAVASYLRDLSNNATTKRDDK